MSATNKSYFDLAKEAILSLKERSGSSPQAIKSYIATTYPDFKFAPVSVLLGYFFPTTYVMLLFYIY